MLPLLRSHNLIERGHSPIFLHFSSSGTRFICGIFVFGVTWLLLGTRSGEHIDREAADEFQVRYSHRLKNPVKVRDGGALGLSGVASFF